LASFSIALWEELGRVERREGKAVPTWLHTRALIPRRLKEDVGVQLDDESGEVGTKTAEHFVPRKERRRNR